MKRSVYCPYFELENWKAGKNGNGKGKDLVDMICEWIFRGRGRGRERKMM